MIPQRVKLTGFLSYKEEQEVCFDGSQLWMLSGVNGSGKSSIFDALTFALFGHHRGGRVDAVELINKDSNTLSIEFDFGIEQHKFRIKRTVRRRASGTASTQQVLAWVPASGDEDARWEAVLDTQLKARFDSWVKDKIGLDYETFTSSVLLLQGKAEKLLDSTPGGRAGVLARIVDLERYQSLHANADEKRKSAKAIADSLATQLITLKDVTEDEYAAALTTIATAEQARTLALARTDELHALELQARRYAEAAAKLLATRMKLQNAESLQGQAVVIEKDHARLKELHDVLPAVATVVTERGRVAESERNTERLTRDRESTVERKRKNDHSLDSLRRKLLDLKKNLTDDEARQTGGNQRLRELATILEKVRQADETRNEAKRLEDELRAMPTDSETTVRELQATTARLAALGKVVLLLDRLSTDRALLVETREQESQAVKLEIKLKADGLLAKKEQEKAEADLLSLRTAREAADSAASEVRALANQADQLADSFRNVEGTKVCRACGQALTPEHLATERKKRDKEAKALRAQADEAAATANSARELESAQVKQESSIRKKRDLLRENYKDAVSEVKRTTTEIDRLTLSCQQSYITLPDDYRLRVSPTPPEDWAEIVYPTADELSALRAESARSDEIARKLRTAQDAADIARTMRAKLDSARDRLAKFPPGLAESETAALRQEQIAKQAEESSVVWQIKVAKKEIAQTETDLDRQQKGLGEIDRTLVEITGKLNLEESVRKQSREAIERAKNLLSPPWQERVSTAGLGEQLQWREESETLIASDIEGRYTRLQAVRGGLESLRAEIVVLNEEAEAFPLPARQPADDIRDQVLATRKEADAHARDLVAAESKRQSLDEARTRRVDLDVSKREADLIQSRYKILAELLGKDRLQRHLVRKAERQIVDYANSVLDRLSRGELYLRLVGSEEGSSPDKALDLEASNRVTGGAPINVAFLSGSQRFRVAVALALGIGQYASKQHRPIESVIIDEGFGCLDRAGRQVMIQELQNLRGHLQRILLVSHQEEFADAFPDGYRFELVGGATRVSRYQR